MDKIMKVKLNQMNRILSQKDITQKNPLDLSEIEHNEALYLSPLK